ncbi:MAG: DUF3368 domain-containing protein [Deltaproteobacteria bacterium]|nr:DUF3368 domain-containing protein [Deltaproteobacteria bacterium]MBW1953974.1 DUF3368 domain-containing protein [Deltaproteobacteria bacterium]MBW1992316.1 DUF3368 domain-containing protein [Deltaproteobacteria bacterium]
MPEIICNTSPLQYLHQIGLLQLLPKMVGRIIIPAAVQEELDQGRRLGIDLPDIDTLPWLAIRQPLSVAALPLVTDLGPGETQVLALALETPDTVALIDDALARRIAETLGIKLTGTLGVLLSAKRAGLLPAVAPFLDHLQELRFRVSPATRSAVLKLAGE